MPATHPVQDALSSLTAREHEVMLLLVDGLRNRDIAARLGISSRTVEKHVEHVLAKFLVSNRRELMIIALTAGAPPTSVDPA